MPRPAIDHEKEAMVLDAVGHFLDKEVRPVAHQLEHDDVWPAGIVEKMKAMACSAASSRKSTADSAFRRNLCQDIENISVVWMSLSGIINSHLIMAAAVQRAGTPGQKKRYLPRFASGEIRGGLALNRARLRHRPASDTHGRGQGMAMTT